ncbi:hypothetical protein ACRALDRAFT_2022165 [Sodiomyces alcalophilus JCM 7366]
MHNVFQSQKEKDEGKDKSKDKDIRVGVYVPVRDICSQDSGVCRLLRGLA